MKTTNYRSDNYILIPFPPLLKETSSQKWKSSSFTNPKRMEKIMNNLHLGFLFIQQLIVNSCLSPNNNKKQHKSILIWFVHNISSLLKLSNIFLWGSDSLFSENLPYASAFITHMWYSPVWCQWCETFHFWVSLL